MNEQEKFDELLRSKLSERDFPFDELNWDEAERLIIQQERISRIKRVSLIFSAGLVAGVLIMLPFIFSNHSTTNNPIVANPTPGMSAVSQNSAMPTVNQSPANTTNSAANNVTAPLPVQSAFVKKNSSTGKRGTSSTTTPVANVSKEHGTVLAAANKPKAKPQHKRISNPIAVASEEQPAKSIRHNKTIGNHDLAYASAKTKKKNHSHTLNKTNTINNPTTYSTTNPIVAQNSNSSNNDKTITNPAVTSNSSPGADTRQTNISSSESKPNPTPVDTIKVAKKTVTPAPYFPNRDSGVNMLRTNDNVGGGSFKPSLFFVGDAGLNYSLGWNNNGDKEAGGTTFIASLRIGYHVSPKLSVLIGAGNYEITNLNKTYTSSIIQYDFGQNASITTVTPKSAMYLRFPVNLQYKISDKFLVTGGFDYFMLLTTSSTVNSYTVNYLGQESGNTTQTQNGYVEGFNNSNFQFTETFTYIPCCRLGINLQFYEGVGYIENKSFPGITQENNLNGLRLFLSYQLMK